VLVADEVIFTESALAEFVAGPAKGQGAGVEKPDLTTPDIPGAIPSIEPSTGTTDLDLPADDLAADDLATDDLATDDLAADDAATDDTEEKA
jgi:large subunit ribosomal protein L4